VTQGDDGRLADKTSGLIDIYARSEYGIVIRVTVGVEVCMGNVLIAGARCLGGRVNSEVVETGLRVKPTRVANVVAGSPYGGVYGRITTISMMIVNECALCADDDRELYEFVPRMLSKKIKVEIIAEYMGEVFNGHDAYHKQHNVI